jgi:hypothetical protein
MNGRTEGNTIQVSAFKAGIYILRITSDGAVYDKKIIIR